MSGLKRFLFSAPVNDASGTQTFYIDAETAEAACERAEHRDTDGMYCDDSEVTDLGELELSSMEVTTVDDSGDFPPLSTAPQPSGQDERAAFECRVYRLAEEEKYSYMTSLLKRDPNTGDYSTSWVDMMWRGWQARSTLTAPSPAVVEPVELSDDELRDLWRSAGGSFYGPRVETGSMPEHDLLPFLRKMLSGKPAVVGGEAVISADELAAFCRFCETCEDFESGGYDVPKEDMQRLARIGVVRWCGGSRYETTDFGDVIRARKVVPPIVEAETVRDQLFAALNETHAALCFMDINAEPGKQYMGSKQCEMNRAAIAAASGK